MADNSKEGCLCVERADVGSKLSREEGREEGREEDRREEQGYFYDYLKRLGVLVSSPSPSLLPLSLLASISILLDYVSRIS